MTAIAHRNHRAEGRRLCPTVLRVLLRTATCRSGLLTAIAHRRPAPVPDGFTDALHQLIVHLQRVQVALRIHQVLPPVLLETNLP